MQECCTSKLLYMQDMAFYLLADKPELDWISSAVYVDDAVYLFNNNNEKY